MNTAFTPATQQITAKEEEEIVLPADLIRQPWGPRSDNNYLVPEVIPQVGAVRKNRRVAGATSDLTRWAKVPQEHWSCK